MQVEFDITFYILGEYTFILENIHFLINIEIAVSTFPQPDKKKNTETRRHALHATCKVQISFDFEGKTEADAAALTSNQHLQSAVWFQFNAAGSQELTG